MVNSRAKGNEAERAVVKILSRYFPGKFERRSMGIAGCDIVCPEDFLWAPEVKNNKMVRLKHFWKPTLQLTTFWVQTKTQAAALGKLPLLIVKAEGLWFCWDNIPNSYDFAHNVWLFEDWCENHAK